MGNSAAPEAGAPSGGGARNGPQIQLNVYVPSQAKSERTAGTSTMNQVTGMAGMAIYHSGVVINGREYTYGGGEGGGTGKLDTDINMCMRQIS